MARVNFGRPCDDSDPKYPDVADTLTGQELGCQHTPIALLDVQLAAIFGHTVELDA